MDDVHLRPVTMKDWEILLQWRNDTETRNNSHHIELVGEEEHKVWLESVLSNNNRQMYLALEYDTPVGVVRADFDKDNDVYELSWTVSPDMRGKGIGKIIVKILAQKLNYRIRAEVKKNNTASVKIAEYAGMTLQKEENGTLHYSNF